MYKIGEALVGKDNEAAHIDLIIGDKEGNVGEAFANGLAKLSAGHTPVLSVIRPNLPSKPYTLVIPKVTIKDMEDANKIFGPAQAAVAKAVADAVEEGIIPRDKIEDWVIICSVFVHPEAKDFRKIYQYNYGATKLALKRALQDYPSLDKIMFDKDRATHPIMGFRVPRLPKWNRPYLQIALDIPDLERTKKIIREIPKSDKIILEAGTPLIKRYGTKVINELREVAKSDFIIADLKTLDVGQVEVDLAFDDGADAVVASGLATVEVIDKFIYEAKRLGIYAILDMMNVKDPVKRLKSLKELPHIVILHRAIDSEKREKHRFGLIRDIKKEFPDLYVAVAGGIEPETVPLALKEGVDIIIVGRFITQSKDIERSTRLFINQLGGDIDLKRVHVE
ncbi:MAG TPA: bifunctional 5,6,7,8-tetrahydromethanopterin hydro-lyase/3-hexulose-6-phosphate synthase [Candidatus Altiarchaeales archaeon]|nr:bifunctional 5,6,7,8-tetrahydromethanopterin hydro-lyase/3-hexulose-6-phosphate synthase [Candidatus Altiarchaeales archaeon]